MRNREGLIKFEGKIFIFHQCPNCGFSLVAAFLPVRKRSIFNRSFFARDLYDRCVLCERYRRPQKKLAILATVSFHMIATTAFFFGSDNSDYMRRQTSLERGLSSSSNSSLTKFRNMVLVPV